MKDFSELVFDNKFKFEYIKNYLFYLINDYNLDLYDSSIHDVNIIKVNYFIIELKHYKKDKDTENELLQIYYNDIFSKDDDNILINKNIANMITDISNHYDVLNDDKTYNINNNLEKNIKILLLGIILFFSNCFFINDITIQFSKFINDFINSFVSLIHEQNV